MSTRLAINGLGRTGRAAFRAAFEGDLDIEVVAVNDVVPLEALAQMLRRDSTYGAFRGTIEVTDAGLRVDGREVRVLGETDPANLPWGELDIDVVIESTGLFRKRDQADRHLSAGAPRVIISAPATDPDVTVALGVNFDDVYHPEQHRIISNASCTTNCLAPVAKVIHEAFGIRHGQMCTIHAYTGDQRLLDAQHKDMRRARSAAVNLVPTTTGAAKAVGLVVPELQGRLSGYAMRAPVTTGSAVDLTVELERPATAEEVNTVLAGRADAGALEGILAYSEEPLVSTDVIGSPYSSIFDSGFTNVIGDTGLHVLAWYDNEWGYSNRLVELATKVASPVVAAA